MRNIGKWIIAAILAAAWLFVFAPQAVLTAHATSPDFVTLKVGIVWNDGNDEGGVRPRDISFQLKKNGEDYGEGSVGDDNNWTYTQGGMSTREANGTAITYTWEIRNQLPEGYTASKSTSADGATTTFTLTCDSLTSSTVEIVWDDANDEDHRRPGYSEPIRVSLCADGRWKEECSIEKDLYTDKWIFTRTGLPKKKDSGETIVYTWRQGQRLDSYDCTGISTVGNNTTLTYTHVPYDWHTITVTNGTADPHMAEPDTDITLTAGAAPTGKAFKCWRSSQNITVTPVNEDGSTAKFSMINDDVTVSAVYGYAVKLVQPASGGTISSSAKVAEEGETVTLTATPATDYTFSRWVVAGLTITDNKLTMPGEPVEISAEFKKKDMTGAVKTDPVNPEPVKTDPVNPDPVKTDPVKTDEPSSEKPAPVVTDTDNTQNVNSTPAPATYTPAYTPSSEPELKQEEDKPITIDKTPKSVKARNGYGKNNKITISWKKLKNTGSDKKVKNKTKKVEVQYSTDSLFKKDVITKKVKKNKTKVTVKELEKNTTYYIRLRYLGKDGASDWSETAAVTTKDK